MTDDESPQPLYKTDPEAAHKRARDTGDYNADTWAHDWGIVVARVMERTGLSRGDALSLVHLNIQTGVSLKLDELRMALRWFATKFAGGAEGDEWKHGD